jgi:glycosyltransferase involved in cell wall biosynthesis
LPYAVDVERFTPRGEAADLGDGTIVLGIGRLVEEKGFVDLIDAVATMEPKPRIALLGEGPMADDLRIHATRSGIDLLLLGGVQDVAPYLRRADAVVFSSHWEGLPAALLEALAVARPVVATTVGGIPDVIRDAQHGLLVPPAQPKALAPAIARALGEEGRALGSRGRALVSERHSWPRYVEMRRMLYESLSQAGNRDSLIRLT